MYDQSYAGIGRGRYVYGREERLRRIRLQRRRAQIRRKRILLVCSVLFLFFSSMILSGFASPEPETQLYRYYTTTVVNSGETLSEIALRYYAQANKSEKSYIREIMEINNMNSTRIYPGETLIIPYYSEENK